METMNPNQTLLQGKNQSPSDTVPATLSGPANAVTFQLQGVQPPSPLYVNRDDALFAQISVPFGDVVTITYRLLLPNGIINTGSFTVGNIGNVSNAPQTSRLQLAEGYLLSLTATGSISTQDGSDYLQVWIVRGSVLAGALTAFYILIADYVTALKPVSWPNSRMRKDAEGLGFIQSIGVTSPGVGTDWTVTVPVNNVWQFVTFDATLTTAVAVANRQPQIVITDGAANRLYTGPANASIPASQVAHVSGVQLMPNASALATDLQLPLPPSNRLMQQFIFSIVTAGLQPADQWSAIRLLLNTWQLT